MALCTRSRVAGLTASGRLRTLLTVPTETPARTATSRMLAVSAGLLRWGAATVAARGRERSLKRVKDVQLGLDSARGRPEPFGPALAGAAELSGRPWTSSTWSAAAPGTRCCAS